MPTSSLDPELVPSSSAPPPPLDPSSSTPPPPVDPSTFVPTVPPSVDTDVVYLGDAVRRHFSCFMTSVDEETRDRVIRDFAFDVAGHLRQTIAEVVAQRVTEVRTISSHHSGVGVGPDEMPRAERVVDPDPGLAREVEPESVPSFRVAIGVDHPLYSLALPAPFARPRKATLPLDALGVPDTKASYDILHKNVS